MCFQCERLAQTVRGHNSPSRTSEHLRVEAAIRALAQARGVKVELASRVGFRNFLGNGESEHGAAERDGSKITYFYDPLHVTPQSLWWSALHELGHVEQGMSADLAIRFAHARGVDHIIEPDAWKRAERMAKLSPWPPTAEFYRLRDYCLGTYGLVA